MEQRKSDINTGDGNVVNVDTNGLSYSFDFSSQVESVPQAAPVQPEVAPQVAPVQPEVATQSEQVQVTEQNVTGEYLIKDKKSTKFFLIVLFALVVAFIVFLPFLYEKISDVIG